MSGRGQHAVSIAIHHRDDEDRVLGVLRPDDPEDHLRGLWGLPATTLRPGESEADALHRLVRDKLGISLTAFSLRRQGSQERSGYTLQMSLYQGDIGPQTPLLPQDVPPREGATYYAQWRWLLAQDLMEASAKGSLCVRLFLTHNQLTSPARADRSDPTSAA